MKSYISIVSDVQPYGVVCSYYEDIDTETFRKIRDLLKRFEVRRK